MLLSDTEIRVTHSRPRLDWYLAFPDKNSLKSLGYYKAAPYLTPPSFFFLFSFFFSFLSALEKSREELFQYAYSTERKTLKRGSCWWTTFFPRLFSYYLLGTQTSFSPAFPSGTMVTSLLTFLSLRHFILFYFIFGRSTKIFP